MTEQLENEADTVVVTIHPDGTVDPKRIVLHKDHDDRILWVSEADFACDMVFTGGVSPFKEHVFRVEKGMWKRSEKIRDEVKPDENFKFHFDAQSKGQTVAAADPDVIIRR